MSALTCDFDSGLTDTEEAFALCAVAAAVGDRSVLIRCARCNAAVRPTRGLPDFLDHGLGSPYCAPGQDGSNPRTALRAVLGRRGGYAPASNLVSTGTIGWRAKSVRADLPGRAMALHDPLD